MRRIKDEGELKELHARGRGFIYNDFSETAASGGHYNVLHAASCRWILKSNARIPKYFFPSLAEAERWLQQNREQEGTGWKRCGTCHARPAPVKGPESQTPPEIRASPAQHRQHHESSKTATRPYLVLARAASSGTSVEAWSRRRLPFEPKGWLAAFRGELRTALHRLVAEPGQLLHGTYASQQKGFFDVENVLFYNVGSSFIRAVGQYGMRYERRYRVPSPPHSLPWPAAHYYGYQLQPFTGTFAYWEKGSLLARFGVATAELSDLADCTRLWLQLKKRGRIEPVHRATGRPFVLCVDISAPPASRLSAADLLKPLTDGIVSAFHGHNGQNGEELCRLLAARTKMETATLRSFLEDDAQAVLGTRRLLWPWGKSIQWNPADELCMAARLRIASERHLTHYEVQGKLYAAHYAGDAR